MEYKNLKGRLLTDEQFEIFARAINLGDNLKDNRHRAEVLGFSEKNISIAPGAIIRLSGQGYIGEHVFIGLYSYINGEVIIGKNSLIGPHCTLAAGNHKFNPETQSFSARTEGDYDNSIVIGEGSWLASNVTVTAGVRIGKANLICAGAVITHDTDDYAIMAGIPASKIGEINPETGKYKWIDKSKKG